MTALLSYSSIYEKQQLKEFKFNQNQLQRGANLFIRALNKRTSFKFQLSSVVDVVRKIKGSDVLFGIEGYVPGKFIKLRVNWEKQNTGLLHSVSIWNKKGARTPNYTVDGLKPDGSEKSLSEIIEEVSQVLKGNYVPQSKSENQEVLVNMGGTDLRDSALEAEIDAIEGMSLQMDSEIERMNRSISRIANPSFDISCLVICGTPGIGKTFNVERILKEQGWTKEPGRNYLRAKATPTQAAIALFNCKDEGQILVFDDCDAPWSQEDTINLFKAAFDEGTGNIVTWKIGASGGAPSDYPDNGAFVFEGKAIFISNLKKSVLVGKGAGAVLSRGEMVELNFTPDQVKQYIMNLLPKLLPDSPATQDQKLEVCQWLFYPRNLVKFPYISIRLVCNTIKLRMDSPQTWKQDSFNYT